MIFSDENFFDLEVEDVGEFECQGEAGVDFATFDGVDRLPGDTYPFSKLFLRPIPFSPEDFEFVLQRYFQATTILPTSAHPIMITAPTNQSDWMG